MVIRIRSSSTDLLFVLIEATDRQQCHQGDVYEQDCNTCTCASGGVYVCTFRKCFGKQNLEAKQTHTTDTVCTPHDTMMIVSIFYILFKNQNSTLSFF